VSEKYRGDGIGNAITEYLMETALKQTPNIYLIATKLGFPVYQKLGFKPDEEYIFYKPHQLTLPVSSNIKAYKPEYKKHILKMNKEFSGEERELLLNPKLKDNFVY